MSGGTFGTNWLDLSSAGSNLFTRTYVQGFVDISGGNVILRNNNLYLTGGDSSLNGRLFVGGDASLNSRLFVGSDVSFGGRIFATGDVSLNSRLYVGGDVSFGGRIFATGDVSLNNRLYVAWDVSLGDNLFVTGDVSLNNRLFVGNDVSLGGRLFSRGDISLNSRLYVGSDVSLGGRLFVVNDASLNGNVSLAKDLTIGGNLYVKAYTTYQTITTLSYQLIVAEDISSSGRLFLAGDGSFNNRLYVASDVSMGGRLFVVGDVSLNSRVFVGSDVSLGGRLSLFNDASFNGRLFLANDASFNQRLFIGSDVSMGGRLFTIGDTSHNARLYVGSDASFGGRIFAVGDVSLNSRVFVGSDVSLGGRLSLFNDASFNGRLFLANDASFNQRLFVGSDVSMGGRLFTVGDTSHNARLYVGSDASFGGRIFAMGDVSLNSRLNVGSDASFGGRLYLNSNSLFVNGVVFTGGSNNFTADVSMNSRLYVGSDVSMGGNLNVAKILKATSISEAFVTNATTASSYTFDYSTGSVFYITSPPTTNFTCNFTNVPADINRNYVITVIINSSTNKVFCNSVQINTNTAFAPSFANGTPASVTFGSLITQSFAIQRVTAGDLAANINLFSSITPYSTTIAGYTVLTSAADASLNFRLLVGSDASFGGRIFATGDVSLNSRLSVGSDVSMGGRLYLNSNSLFVNGVLFTGGSGSFSGDISVNSRIYVGSDVSMGGRLFVMGDVSLNNRFFLTGDASLNSRLYVGSDVSMGGRLFLANDASFNQRLFVGSDISLGGRLFAVGDVSLNSRVFVGSDVSLGGRLSLFNDASFNGRLFLANDASFNQRLFVGSDVSMGGRLFTAGDTSHNARLYVGSDVSLGGRLFLVNDASLNGNVYLAKDLTIGGNLYVKAYTTYQTITTLSYQLIVAEDISSSGRLFLAGDGSFNNRLYVASDVSMGGRLFAAGDVSLNSRLYVGGDVSMASRLFVYGDVSMGGNLTISSTGTFTTGFSAFAVSPLTITSTSGVPTTGTFVYSAMSDTGFGVAAGGVSVGLYKTNDGGITWSVLNNSLTNLGTFGASPLALWIDTTGQYILYALNNSSPGFYYSSNYGATFQVCGGTLATANGGYNFTLTMAGGSGYGFMMGANIGANYTTNYGATWTASTTAPTINPYGTVCMSADGKFMAKFTYGGSTALYRSTDFGNTWQSVTVTATGNFWVGAASATGEYMIMPNSTSPIIYTSSTYGLTWTAVTVTGATISYQQPCFISATGQYQYVYGAFSTDYGVTWRPSTNYIDAMSRSGKYILKSTGTGLYYRINTIAPQINLGGDASFNGNVSMNSNLFIGTVKLSQSLGLTIATPSTTYTPNTVSSALAGWSNSGINWTTTQSSILDGASLWRAFNGPTGNLWKVNGVYAYTGGYSGSASTVITGVGTILGEWGTLTSNTAITMNSFNFTNEFQSRFCRSFYILGANSTSPASWTPILYGVFTSLPFTNAPATTTSTYYVPTGTTVNSQQSSLRFTTYGNGATSFTNFRIVCPTIIGNTLGVTPIDGNNNTNLTIQGWNITFGNTNTNTFTDGTLNVVSNNTDISGTLTSRSDIIANNRLYVTGDVSLGSRLFTAGDVSMNSRLYVGGDASFGGRIFAMGDASMGGRLYLGGNYSVILTSGLIPVPASIPAASSWTNSGITWTATASSTSGTNYPYLTFNPAHGPASWYSAASTYATTSPFGYIGAAATTIQNGVGAVAGEWIQLQSSTQIVMQNYVMSLPIENYATMSYFPQAYYICGSTDGSTWYPIWKFTSSFEPSHPGATPSTNLYTIPAGATTSTVYSGAMSGGTYTTYGNGTTSYTYFRMVITNIVGTNYGATNGSAGQVAFTRWIINFATTNNGSTLGYLATSATVANQIDISGATLNLFRDASLNSRLFVGGDASLNSRLFVGGDVSLNQRLYVGSDVSLGGRLFLGNDASLNGNLSLAKDLTVTGGAGITGNVFVGGNVVVSSSFRPTIITEPFATNAGTTSPYTFDYSTGPTFYITTPPASNFTCNFTNVPADINRTYVATIIIKTSSNRTFCNTVQINSNGTAFTPYFANGIPTSIATASMITQTISIQRLVANDAGPNGTNSHVLSAVIAYF